MDDGDASVIEFNLFNLFAFSFKKFLRFFFIQEPLQSFVLQFQVRKS